MSERELPRLFEAAADAELRAALRTIRSDAPDRVALLALAERTRDAVQHGAPTGSSAGQRHSSGWKALAKITFVSCSAAALYVATQRGFAPGATQRAPAVPNEQPAAFEPHEAPHAPRTAAAAPRAPTPEVSELPASAPRDIAPAPAASPRVTTARAPQGAARRSSAPHIARASRPVEAAVNEPQSARETREPTTPRPLDELMQLEEAQRVLALDAQRALLLLSQHSEAFPHSHYEQEREVLLLDVLSRLGRSRELHERARAFQQRYPGSAHQVRVDAILEAERR